MKVQAQAFSNARESGASMAEFLIAAPVLLLIGLGTLQVGLVYHGKATLNYATFEAVRTGAVNHALTAPMRDELGIRLAPLYGGDGSSSDALAAIAKSRLDVGAGLFTNIRVLSPDRGAFDDWSVVSSETGKRVIPNSHLRHMPEGGGASSGVSLRDANVLSIEVTHGLPLKVPIINKLLSAGLAAFDRKNSRFYAQMRLPLTAQATIRMQSDVWRDDLEVAGSLVANPRDGDASGQSTGPVSVGGRMPGTGSPDGTVTGSGTGTDNSNGAGTGTHGGGGSSVPAPTDSQAGKAPSGGELTSEPIGESVPGGTGSQCTTSEGRGEFPLLDSDAYTSGECSVADLGYSSPVDHPVGELSPLPDDC